MSTVSWPTRGSARGSYFVFTAGQGRVRRPRDLLKAVIGLFLVVWAVIASGSVSAWTQSLTDLVSNAPQWVHLILGTGYLMSLVYAIVVTAGLFVGGEQRGEPIRDLVLVIVFTLGLVVVLSWIVNGALPYFFPEIDLKDPVPQFPVTRVALVTAILLVVSPYVTRPLRRLGWIAILVTASAAIALSYGSPIHAAGSFGVGMLTAGLLLVTVGTPKGYPSPDSVSEGMTRLGVPNRDIRQSAKQDWGLVRFVAVDDSGRSIEIKAHGRDSFDSQVAAKVWRTLMYREMGPAFTLTRLQAVEHEALVNLMTDRAGVPVLGLRGVGKASPELALIAFDRGQARLSDLDQGQIDDGLLVELWEIVARMHAAAISHGRLRAESVHVVERSPRLADMDLGSLSADEGDRSGDVVELLFSLAAVVGVDRAVETAIRGLGTQGLLAAMPYLQTPAVSADSRRRVDKPKQLVADLTDRILEVTGAEKPAPVEIRRVTLRSLLTVALILLLGSALLPLLTGIDYGEIWGVLQDADWALVALGVIVGHLQFFPSTTSTMFAVTAKLPFWPLFVLQTASQFISLAVPSAAGRVAMNAAFLRKFGVPTAAAVAQGAIDGFSGFLVQAVILLVLLLTGYVDLGLEIDSSDIPWLTVLAVVAGVAVVGALVLWRVRRLREKIAPFFHQGWGALVEVLSQPSRALGLIVSNFVFWNVLGITLWVLLTAVGSPLSYGSALFVATGTSLLAGVMPVPGGVGVAEATMAAMLATFGAEQTAAFAVTVVYRMITFYLPALEGLFGARWLERNDYI